MSEGCITEATHLFIADLHLEPDGQPTLELALRFLNHAQGKEHLYILGDLFEYWLGDDAGIHLYEPFINALSQLSDSGCQLTVLHGNRDFLLGQHFAQQCGAMLITDDELVITLGDIPVLLMHGDTLCTDDPDYQRFRTRVRSATWQRQFLSKTIDEREYQAEALRTASNEASSLKEALIMDVNADTVSARLLANGCETLIHGHTHRPAVHTLNNPATTRLVVGDWHPDQAQYVAWNGAEFSLRTFAGN